MFSLRLAAIGMFAAALLCGLPARAHGNLRALDRSCVLKVGPDLVYFSGYQPAASHRKFCEDIPAVGDTIFVFDYAQSEMREMSADFRIIRDMGQGDLGQNEGPAQLQADTVAYLPPKVYPQGTLNFEHMFKEPGDYVGIVTVSGPHGEQWVSRFPFSVGRLVSPRAPYYLLATAAALALLLWVWGKDERKRPAG